MSYQRQRGSEPEKTVLERVLFHGHPMVRALHPTTIEITTEEHLTERGDCIIGIGASSGCAGLRAETRRALGVDGARVSIRILVAGERFEVRGVGDSRLPLSNQRDIVIRRSTYVDGRTLAVRADFAAVDIPRKIVETLKRADASGVLEVEVTQH